MKTIQIANAKEKLFHFRTVSDTLLWNHVVNGSSKKLSLEILEFFL